MNVQSTKTASFQQELIDRYQKVRNLTLEICAPLQPEDFVVQPVDEVSPPKWHIAHTTWFFETFILKRNVQDYKFFDKDYPFLFNSYYETEGARWNRSQRGVLSRPWVNEIMAYRDYVDEHIIQYLMESELSEELKRVFEIGLNHEQQHQELLIYDVKHILGINPLFPVYHRCAEVDYEPNLTNQVLKVDEGVYKVGHEGSEFHFDNEEGAHKTYLNAFEISDRLVTNGEFLEFIESGGYEDFKLWLMEGYEWVKSENIKAPFYWFIENNEWHYYTFGGKQKIDDDEPVSHISFYEADAFAKWKGMRLPTEFEWEVACKKFSAEIPKEANLLNERSFRAMPRKGSNFQFFGDAWEWTNSAYLPYPSYQKVDGALGEYNGKFMVNQMVLRGGSYATMRDHIRPTYRNFFHPNLRWQITGLRLARNI